MYLVSSSPRSPIIKTEPVRLQPLREGLQFEHNGKTYEITFHKTRESAVRVNGNLQNLTVIRTWKILNLLNDKQEWWNYKPLKNKLANKLEQQLTAILGNSSLTDDQKTELLNSRSFTLHFTLKYDEGTGSVFPVLNAIFGRAVSWFQDDLDSRLSRLTKITYMPADGAPKKTLKINLEELQGTPEEIVAKKKNLSQTAINIHNLVTQVAKIRPPQQPANPPAVATPPPSIGSAADPNRPINVNNNNNATDSIHQVD